MYQSAVQRAGQMDAQTAHQLADRSGGYSAGWWVLKLAARMVEMRVVQRAETLVEKWDLHSAVPKVLQRVGYSGGWRAGLTVDR